MIYFVVAQRDEDGKWEIVLGPQGDIDGIDDKIADLDEDPKYSQAEIARVITQDDKLQNVEWDGIL